MWLIINLGISAVLAGILILFVKGFNKYKYHIPYFERKRQKKVFALFDSMHSIMLKTGAAEALGVISRENFGTLLKKPIEEQELKEKFTDENIRKEIRNLTV